MLTKEARIEAYQAGVAAALEEFFGKEAGVAGSLLRMAPKAAPSALSSGADLLRSAAKPVAGMAAKQVPGKAGLWDKLKGGLRSVA